MLEYRYSEFSDTDKRIARYFIDANPNNSVKITDVAQALYVSTASISRFVNRVGFENYKSFIYEYEKAFQINQEEIKSLNQEAMNMWTIHTQFYERLYSHMATIDIMRIVKHFMSASRIYTYAFGKTQETMNMIVYRLESVLPTIRSVNHYEHLMYSIDSIITPDSLIVLFYHSDYFSKQLHGVLKECNKKGIHVVVLTLNDDIQREKTSHIINLYPYKDKTLSHYATTLYTPFLLFMDTVYLAILRFRKENL